MSLKNALATWISASSVALALAACTKSAPQVNTPIPAAQSGGQHQDTQNQQNQQGPQNSPQSSQQVNPSATDNNGQVSMTLEKGKFGAKVDTNNLFYKLTYLTYVNGPTKITFDQSGKAQLKFQGLPADQSGLLTFQILEGTTLKYQATKDGLKLAKGQNTTIDLNLVPVDPNGNSTDLTINVTLDGGANNPLSPAPATPVPNVMPTIPPTQPNVPNQPNQPIDPIANWDGLTDQGNSLWTIVPIGG